MKLLSIMSILLCCIVLSGEGIQPQGVGTENSPYLVESLDNLLWITTNQDSWDSHFLQTFNIDASETESWNDGHGFEPIGNIYYDHGWVYEYFSGVYDGGGYSISNLYINNPVSRETTLGFFRIVENAIVQNLILDNFSIYGEANVGLLCGRMANSYINSVSLTGDITISGNYAGGLSAKAENSIIRNSTTNVNITIPNHNKTSNKDIGGFVGVLSENSQVTDCQSTLNFHSENKVNSLGGFVGRIMGTPVVNNCSSSATMSCDGDTIGGFVGTCYGKIFNSSCYVELEYVNEPCQRIGGFVGYLIGTDITWPSYMWHFPEINSCSAAGSIGGWIDVGGFVGFGSNFNLKNCYTKTDITAYEFDTGMHIFDPHDIGTFGGNITIESFPDPTIILGAFSSYSANTISLVPESLADDFVYGMHGGGYFMGYECYLDYELLGVNQEDVHGSLAYSTEEMKDVETYTNNNQFFTWDFVGNPFEDDQDNDYWDIDPAINDGYPYLTNSFEVIVSNEDSEQVVIQSDIMINSLYPNPFNPTTTISYTLGKKSNVLVDVFNIKGQKVYSEKTGVQEVGNHKFIWNGVNSNKNNVASGVYLFKIKTESQECLTKGILMK